MKLTKAEVERLNLPEGKTDHIIWDDSLPGFGLRLRGERRTYVIQYRAGKQQRRESLGDVRRVTLEAARTIARKRFAEVELGGDPGADRAKLRDEAAAVVLSFADIADRYIAAKSDIWSTSTYKSTKRHLNVQWEPLARRPFAEIKRAEIAARLQEVVKESGRTAGARARGTLSSLYSWAMREGLVESNPVIATNDPLAGIDNSRDRVLSDSELVKVWNACGDDDFGRAARLLILTGCRRNEIGALRWSEINLDAGTVSISGDRTKTGKAHVLTLPPMALDIIRAIPRRDGRNYVFGVRGDGFTRWGAYTRALRSRLGGMQPFTIHDFRRTFRTGLGRLGTPSHVAELAIGHTRQGIESVYDRHRYEQEIASALAAWANHVSVSLGGRIDSNVVQMARNPR